jgi:hypothetical protein
MYWGPIFSTLNCVKVPQIWDYGIKRYWFILADYAAIVDELDALD